MPLRRSTDHCVILMRLYDNLQGLYTGGATVSEASYEGQARDPGMRHVGLLACPYAKPVDPYVDGHRLNGHYTCMCNVEWEARNH